MPLFNIATPSDQNLYPLRVHETAHAIGAELKKGDILAVLEARDGRKLRMSCPVAGILRQPPEPGAIYMERAPIAVIEQIDDAPSAAPDRTPELSEPPKRSKPSEPSTPPQPSVAATGKTDRANLARFIFPVSAVITVLLVATAIIGPKGFEDAIEDVFDDSAFLAGELAAVIAQPFRSITDGASNPSGSSSPSRTANTTSASPQDRQVWTAQLADGLPQPADLSAVDNGFRPAPSETTKAAFQAWLEK